MIACYARGGGLGHLTRLRAYLHTVRAAGPVAVVSSSPFTADPRVAGGWDAATLDALPRLAPDEVIVDAFPAGLHGELSAASVPPGTPVTHLARLLRWDVYRARLPARPLRFARTYLMEELEPEHEAWLRTVSDTVAPLELVEPPAPPARLDGWLVVHSGPDAEIRELVAYALDMAATEGVHPPLTLVAPHRPDGLPPEVAHRDAYPAWPLGEHAARIVTGAGFNAVRQFAPWRDRHRVLPFPRTLDDQYARAARLRR
ncbi:hypothetical protein [Actinomadura parmotrematis]|uniref:Glycosyl transferase n=1 Tax=Actinomadura parmotrematis TaxID=2864039 RepID=A0ABS7FZC1_9ACTN|nr:hypothetical protein [Actinomadura parmotrematis]MBW8485794.1 hypothetical protein [Actinomadura parmotrematis]